MITVNPRSNALDKELIEAYRKIAAATLGHALESAMGPSIRALWRPVKLVGPALTVLTTADVTSALHKAQEVAQPGDVLVVHRGGDMRHGTTGEFGMTAAMEHGIVGLVTDGLVADSVGLEQMKFPVFCSGVSATLVNPLGLGLEVGAVNLPVRVGGIVVSPGDLILADDDGVMVASPKEAGDSLAFCQEMEQWEEYARAQMASGRSLLDIRRERESFRERYYGGASS